MTQRGEKQTSGHDLSAGGRSAVNGGGCANTQSGGDALGRLLHGGERAVPLRHFELDPTGAGDARTADLGATVLETFRHHDLNTVRRAGYRIADRLNVFIDVVVNSILYPGEKLRLPPS